MLLAIVHTGIGNVAAAAPGRVVRDVIPVGAAGETQGGWIAPYTGVDIVVTPEAEGPRSTDKVSTCMTPTQRINDLNRKIQKAFNRRQILRAYDCAVELAHILGGCMGLEVVDLPEEQLEAWWAMRQWSIESIAEAQRLHRLVTGAPSPTLTDGINLYRITSVDMQVRTTTTPGTGSDQHPARPAVSPQAAARAKSGTRTRRRHPPSAPKVAPTQYVIPRAPQPTESPLIPGPVARAEDVRADDAPTAIVIHSQGEDPATSNMRTISAMHELAMYMTSTPIWTQVETYRMCASGEAIIPNQGIVLPEIQEQWDLLQTFATDLIGRFQELEHTIRGAIRAKERGYREYLAYVRTYTQHTPMSHFKAVDRGQTSGNSRNTCMFNSLFAQEVTMGNIRSTKEGAIQAGLTYLQWLADYYRRYNETADDILINPGGVRESLMEMQRNRRAEQEYGPGAETSKGRYVPGQLSNCSAAEIQSHTMGLNYMMVLKQKTGLGDTLGAHYGTAYLGSEHYPIVLISCSTHHAQALERATPRAKSHRDSRKLT
ncbi:MAG: hypothetical protein LBD43_00650 [Holosporales bacterium]|jgi:hypothetical protein|nr:hypothetical protein [Holosporales bacterium]